MFFNIVLKKDNVKILEKFLDQINKNLIEDTIQSFQIILFWFTVLCITKLLK